MTSLWSSLIPLIVGGVVVPIQIIITVMLLRSSAGKLTAVAWVAGMTAVRLVQGLLFGLVFGSVETSSTATGGPGTAIWVLLLALAVMFYVTAAKNLLKHPDEDAPPPKWMAMIEGVRPGKAFALGAGVLGIGAKFWVFTLGAIAAIADAGLGSAAAIGIFILFVVLTESIHLILLVIAFALPERSAGVLDSVNATLKKYNRVIMIVLGLVFGTWFLIKALSGLGLF